jgi:hypothetical protein
MQKRAGVEALKGEPKMPKPQKPKTNITRKHKQTFDALSSGKFNNFALVSCFVNGAPAAAIAAITQAGEEYIISPLFVSVTKQMQLTDHDSRPA